MTKSIHPGRPPLAQICEAMWEVEKKIGLVERQIADAPYWPLVRQQIVAGLKRQLLGSHADPASRASLFRHAMRQAKPVVADLLAGIAIPPDPFDTILIPLARQLGRNSDAFSVSILEDPGLGRILVLDPVQTARTDGSTPVNGVAGFRAVHSAILIAAAKRVPRLLRASTAEQRLVDATMTRVLGVRCPVSPVRFALRAAVFSEGRRLMREILERSRAKRVLFVGPQWRNGIAASARDLGLQAAEIQHGAISPYHMAYHYPGRPAVPVFADLMLMFGPFWAQNVELPSNITPVVIGSPSGRRRSRERNASGRRVLIPSHMPSDHRLFDMVRRTAQQAPDWEFVFRPHPDENVDSYRQRMSAPISNLRLSPATEDLFTLLDSSDVQIGVCSTVLFEGLSAGLRTIIVSLTGHEIMERIVDEGDAVCAADDLEIVRHLSTAPSARDRSSYFSIPVPSVAEALKQASHV